MPAVFLVPGSRSGGGSDGGEGRGDFHEHHYHQPSDEIGLPVDWPSALRFLDANVQVGREVADSAERPTWNPGDFFGETFGRDPQAPAPAIVPPAH